jgi:hypothetical protein
MRTGGIAPSEIPACGGASMRQRRQHQADDACRIVRKPWHVLDVRSIAARRLGKVKSARLEKLGGCYKVNGDGASAHFTPPNVRCYHSSVSLIGARP